VEVEKREKRLSLKTAFEGEGRCEGGGGLAPRRIVGGLHKTSKPICRALDQGKGLGEAANNGWTKHVYGGMIRGDKKGGCTGDHTPGKKKKTKKTTKKTIETLPAGGTTLLRLKMGEGVSWEPIGRSEKTRIRLKEKMIKSCWGKLAGGRERRRIVPQRNTVSVRSVDKTAGTDTQRYYGEEDSYKRGSIHPEGDESLSPPEKRE